MKGGTQGQQGGFSRRDFFRLSAVAGGSALLAPGCASLGLGCREPMLGFAADPIERPRVGIIGLGERGLGAVGRQADRTDIVISALCDIRMECCEKSRQMIAKGRGKMPAPKVYGGTEDAWKQVCESDDVDLVYICTPWLLHTPMAVYAMKCGKHVAVEVPAAMTLDECWELVETSEKTRRHCVMLENCCYGESELLALNLCRKGMLGDLVHGECAYIHDLCDMKLKPDTYYKQWRGEFSKHYDGNPYPTHGLGPVCQYMDVNRGDRLTYLVSMSSASLRMNERAKALSAEFPWLKPEYQLGDMNTTLIKTHRGRTIMVQHDTHSPRPYSRINLIQGTKGILADYPLRVALAPNSHDWLKPDALAELKKQFAHPLWREEAAAARAGGGHGGMDSLMESRLFYCLRKGLAPDMDVYDAALWSALVPLTAQSVKCKSASIDVPDFTRGGWMTAAPLGIVDKV